MAIQVPIAKVAVPSRGKPSALKKNKINKNRMGPVKSPIDFVFILQLRVVNFSNLDFVNLVEKIGYVSKEHQLFYTFYVVIHFIFSEVLIPFECYIVHMELNAPLLF
ncbi:hypothetical protein GCM10022259_09850 [Aquimarina mytili]